MTPASAEELLAAVREVILEKASRWDALDGSDPAIGRGMRMAWYAVEDSMRAASTPELRI